MNAGIEQMLEAYDIRDLYDRKNAMKEIMQEIVLCGLSRANFFQEAAFYGGTALRIFYGLDRFSEDLDFSLKMEDDAFDLALYFPALEKEVRSFGLNLTVEKKEKLRESNIQSAFLKGNTKEHLLLFYVDEGFTGGVSRDEKIKIRCTTMFSCLQRARLSIWSICAHVSFSPSASHPMPLVISRRSNGCCASDLTPLILRRRGRMSNRSFVTDRGAIYGVQIFSSRARRG